jgi:hypothetical protein
MKVREKFHEAKRCGLIGFLSQGQIQTLGTAAFCRVAGDQKDDVVFFCGAGNIEINLFSRQRTIEAFRRTARPDDGGDEMRRIETLHGISGVIEDVSESEIRRGHRFSRHHSETMEASRRRIKIAGGP